MRSPIVPVIVTALGLLLLFQRRVWEALIDALNRFRGGGPPSPMHPLPADDGALLRLRRRRRAGSQPFVR